MKKVVFLSLVCLCAVCGETVAATYNCKVQPLKVFQGVFRKDDSIFLYPTVGNYRSDDALVCGHQRTNGCDDRTQVVVAGHHVFRGVTDTDMKVYTCDSVGLNEWNDSGYTSLPECKDGQERSWDKIGVVNEIAIYCNKSQNTFYSGKYCLNACFYVNKGGNVDPVNPVNPTNDCDKDGYERATKNYDLKFVNCNGDLCTPIKKGGCYPSDMLDCAKAAELGDPAAWTGKICECGNRQVWNPKNKRCESGKDDGFCTTLKKRGATAERLACCNAGSETKWVNASGVEVKDSLGKTGEKCVCKDAKKKWNSAKGICETQGVVGGNCDKYMGNPNAYACCQGQIGGVSFWDEINKKCHCFDTTKQWDDNKHMCIAGTTGDEICYYTFSGTIDCGNGRRVSRTVSMQLSKSDLNGLRCDKFQELYGKDVSGFKALADKLCAEYGEDVKLDIATQNAIKKVNEFFGISDANRNVWRDADGKFNTTRLVSDATAGVVLGTVGGIVSGKIIKKKQLEKGYDVLHCTVGGQKMADYGDTFQVSYQR